jgi:hypothetical protein
LIVIIVTISVLSSFLIRPEALLAIIPVIVQVLPAYQEPKPFFRSFFSRRPAIRMLSIVAGASLCILASTSLVFGVPKYACVMPAPGAIAASFRTDRHNLVILMVLPLDILAMLCTGAPALWPLPLLGTSIEILLSRISGHLDALLLRRVFPKHVIHIAAGIILYDKRMGLGSTPWSWFLLVTAIYFFIHPIH